MRFTINHTDTTDLVRRLKVILGRLGYIVTPANPGTCTVRELAALVHRKVSTVSRSLRRPSCPPFVSTRGRKRIITLEPNDVLISYLQNQSAGQRNDLREDPYAGKRKP